VRSAGAVLGRFAVSTILLFGSVSCGAGAPATPEDAGIEDVDVTPVQMPDCTALQVSGDEPLHTEPRRAACEALARASGSDEDRRRLLGHLASEDYLEAIETDDVSTYDELVLFEICQRLARIPGGGWLERLITVESIQRDALRMQALIYALALVRPPAPESLHYWRQLANPDSPLAYDVVAAALSNGSPESLALIGEMIADPAYPDEEKIAWLRETFVPRRGDPALLAACLEWLQSGLAGPVAAGLIEALFTYEPGAWYHVSDPPQPPQPSAIQPDAARARHAIAQWALSNLPLDDRLRTAVRDATRGG
jgi:hypothetical protein